MSKLLVANFIRLIKSRIFWIANIFMAGYSIFIYSTAAANVSNGIYNINWNLYFFNDILLIGFIMAVFTSFFLETEYHDGTIRNKIIVGHTRRRIYLANFITCVVAGLIFMVVFAAVSVIAGSLLVDSAILTSLVNIGWCVVLGTLIMIVYTAVFVAIAMLDSKKARSAATSVLIALIFLIVGFLIYNDLQEPELTNRTVFTETGELKIEENIPNSNYVSGMKRVIWEMLALLLPSVQGMQIIAMDGVFSLKIIFSLIIVAVAFCALGMCIFQRKEIK